jgi:hypothetical protein
MFSRLTKALNDAGKDIQRSVDSAVKSISELEQRERERVKVSDVQYYKDVLRVPVGLPLQDMEFNELMRQWSDAVPIEKERILQSVGLRQGRALYCHQVVQLIKRDQIPINAVGAAVIAHPRCVDLANWTMVENAFDVPNSRAWCQERIRHATTAAASAQAAVMQQGMPPPVVTGMTVGVMPPSPTPMPVPMAGMAPTPTGMTVSVGMPPASPMPMPAAAPMTVAPAAMPMGPVIAVAPPMAPVVATPQQQSLEVRVANLEATVAALLAELRLTRLAVGMPDPLVVAAASQQAAMQQAAMQQAAANAAAAQQAAAANAAAAQQAAAVNAAAAAAVTAGTLAATGAMMAGAVVASNNAMVVADPMVMAANNAALANNAAFVGGPGVSMTSTTADIPGGMFSSASMTAPIMGGSVTESSSAFNQDFGNSHHRGSSHSISSTQTGESNFSFGGMNMTGSTTVTQSSSHSESSSSSISFGGGF